MIICTGHEAEINALADAKGVTKEDLASYLIDHIKDVMNDSLGMRELLDLPPRTAIEKIEKIKELIQDYKF